MINTNLSSIVLMTVLRRPACAQVVRYHRSITLSLCTKHLAAKVVLSIFFTSFSYSSWPALTTVLDTRTYLNRALYILLSASSTAWPTAYCGSMRHFISKADRRLAPSLVDSITDSRLCDNNRL